MIVFLLIIFIFYLLNKEKTNPPINKTDAMLFKYNEKISIIPEQAKDGPDGLKITLTGYGHKITGDGSDFSFLNLKAERGADYTLIQIKTPIKEPQKYEWNEFEFIFLKCDDGGPPHSQTEPTELIITKK